MIHTIIIFKTVSALTLNSSLNSKRCIYLEVELISYLTKHPVREGEISE